MKSKGAVNGRDGTEGTEGMARESYVEIGTPRDTAALLSPPEDALWRGSWPLRSAGSLHGSRQESYFELRGGNEEV